MLATAFAVAGTRGARGVAIGSNSEDGQRADGTRTFRDAVARAAGATSPTVRLLALLAQATKREVVAYGLRLGAPLHATVSCYVGVAGGCRTCRGCTDRALAFAAT
jgi:7-cyano-7-deazaguanine synthase